MMAELQTVFIVDDNQAVRNSLSLLLDSVGLATETFSSAQAFVDSFEPSRCGCMILDIRMPGMGGMELARHLRERNVLLPIIFITAYGDVPMAVEAMKLGALDFIQKPFRDQDILDRIYRALEEDQQQRRAVNEVTAIRQRLARLTPREQQILEHIMAGRVNKVIASELNLSPRTVELHRASLMEKMEAASLAIPRMASMIAAAGKKVIQ
jgi:FixJ family two-component response regulator